MATDYSENIDNNLEILNNLLNACNDETRKAGTIAHIKLLLNEVNQYYLNKQLEYIADELYHDITGTSPVHERPCEI